MEKKWLHKYNTISRKNTFFSAKIGIFLYCFSIFGGLAPFVNFTLPLIICIFFPAPITLIVMFLQKYYKLRHEYLLFTIMCTFTLSTALLPLFVNNQLWQSMLGLANIATLIIPAILILTKAKNVVFYVSYAVIVNFIVNYFFADYSYELLVGPHAVSLSVAVSTIFLAKFKYSSARNTFLLNWQLNKKNEEMQFKNHEILEKNEELNQLNEEMQFKNHEILEKNEELNQLNEEIQAQADNLEAAFKQIESHHLKIKSSIKYASTIQKAILPAKESVDKHLQTFVLFRPKDVVSGDFYWFAYLPAKDTFCAKIFIAAVDCTGHGVPGAFMSMIGSRLLNEIVNERKITNTAKILELLDAGIIKSLKQNKSRNNDGMDVCLCRIEKQENQGAYIQFSGAKRPLFLYKADSGKIEIIKGSRRSIGGVRRNLKKSFATNLINVEKNDILYLTSDGYIDQNNSKRERFGTKNFVKLLNKIATKDLNKQKEILDVKLTDYIGISKQRDDITILGVKTVEK